MKLSLNARILALALALVLVILVVGGAGFWASQQLVSRADHAAARLGDTQEVLSAANMALQQYQAQAELIINQDLAAVERFEEVGALFAAQLKKLAALVNTPEETKILDGIRASSVELSALFHDRVVPEIKHQRQKLLRKYDEDSDRLIGKVEEMAVKLADSFRKRMKISMLSGEYERISEQAYEVEEINRLVYYAIRHYQAQADLIINQDMKAIDDYDRSQADFDELHGKLAGAMSTEAEKEWFAELSQAYESYDTVFREQIVPLVERRLEDRLGKAAVEAEDQLFQIEEGVSTLVAKLSAEAEKATQSYRGTAAWVELTLVALALAAAVLGIGLALWLARSISKPIKRVVEGLDGAALQMASASGQVSSASQSLAEGASQQAASLEETSASLEELAAMTRRNAEHAQSADSMMKDAGRIVQEAGTTLADLSQAMERATTASEETAGIIKTIDEIAFQTNLLALNAAVEAARAGEAGAGFAVVADEVRNLAMRAAEAAKHTAELIEGNLDNTKQSGELAQAANQAFGKVRESAAGVGELVGEIASASQEQSQGIGQISTAVGEMDQVTQRVAAGAEESASAAAQLDAQAAGLRDMVGSLDQVVKGGKANSRPHQGELAYQPGDLDQEEPKALPEG